MDPDRTYCLFSPDGRNAAYVVRSGRSDDPNAFGYVVVGTEKGPEASWIGATRVIDYQGQPVFSPDGTQIAYAARRGPWDGAKWFVVVGTSKGEEFDEVEDPFFSPHGNHVAYLATLNQKTFVVVDGRRLGTAYDGVLFPVFLPNGSALAFVARRVTGPDGTGGLVGRYRLVVGNWEGPEYDRIGKPVFDHSARRVAYAAEDHEMSFVVVDDHKGASYDHVSQPVFSPDGGRFAYGACRGEKWFLVVDGVKSGPDFDWVGNPVFSPDGMTIAYEAIRSGQPLGFGAVAGKRCVVLGKSVGEDSDYLSSVTLGSDGRLTYLMCQNDKWFAVSGAEKLGEHFDSLGLLTVSPDGSSVAFVAYQGQSCFVVAGKSRSESWDNIHQLSFSPDGRSLVYGARRGAELWWKVLRLR